MKKLKLTQGFTIIELISVMVIIMIIAGLVVGTGRKVRENAMITEAETMIAALEIAIGMYHADTGVWPSDDFMWQDLYEDASGIGSSWRGPYMEFDSSDFSNGDLVDPWGTPYMYTADAPNNNLSSFDLWSYGPDREDDSGFPDDVTNW